MVDQKARTTRTSRALIRQLYRNGKSYRKISRLVGCSPNTVYKTVCGYSYADNTEEDDKYLSGDLEDLANIEALKASGLRLEEEEKRREVEEVHRKAWEGQRAMRGARWRNTRVPKNKEGQSASGDTTSSSTTRKEGPSDPSCLSPNDPVQDGASSASPSSIATQSLDAPPSPSGLNHTDRRPSHLEQQGLDTPPAEKTKPLDHKQDCARSEDIIVIDDTDDEETVGTSERAMKGSGVKVQEVAERSEMKIMAGADGDRDIAMGNDMKVKTEPKADPEAAEDIEMKDEAEEAQVKGKAVAGKDCNFQRPVKRKISDASLDVGTGTNTKPRVIPNGRPVAVRTEIIVIEDDSDKESGPSTSHSGEASAGGEQGSDSKGGIPSPGLCVAEEHAGIAAAIGLKTASDVQALVQLDEGEHRFIEADLHRKGFSTFDYMKFMHSLRAECV